MSDIVRMLRVSESDPVQQEAADEIERLRVELAAEREKTADYGKQIDWLADEIDWVEDEVVAQEKALEEDEAERDALRALLREALAHLKTGQWNVPTDITLMARIDAALNKGGK